MYLHRLMARSGKRRSSSWTTVVGLAIGLLGVSPLTASTPSSQSDLNNDGVVDLEDLKIFSAKFLGQDWQTVDWCAWIEVEDGKLQAKYDELVDFIREYFQCDAPQPPPGPGPLAVKNQILYPTRLAWGPDGKLYVSDPKVQSVFIYDLVVDEAGIASLNLTGELKRVGRAVGVAVDAAGLVYVGNSKDRRVDKFDQSGRLVGSVGDGTLLHPTDLTFDAKYNLYVADAEGAVVRVFAPSGALLRIIGLNDLVRPMGVEVAYFDGSSGFPVEELFVADKKTYLVKVYDLQGNFLRSFGGFVQKVGWFNPTWNWKGKFVGLQSLAVDGNGDLHALDSFMTRCQILDSVNGDFLSAYGERGTAPGQLGLPLDIIVSDTGRVIVTDAKNRRVAVINTIP